MRTTVAFGFAFLVFLSPSLVATSSGRDAHLKAYLRTYIGDPYPDFEKGWPTQYSVAFVDLNRDGKQEAIVYLSGRGWCGTGGCRALILTPYGTSYKVLTQTTITGLPIRVLNSETNGWHDLSVVVSGGGVEPGYEAILAFDGKSYPSNPSVLPARRAKSVLPGRIAIGVKARSKRLYR